MVQESIYNRIEAAVEICHVVTSHKQPLWDPGDHGGRVRGHNEPDEVERGPADGKKYKNDKHGDEVPEVLWLEFGFAVRFDPPPDLENQDPDS